MLAHISHGGSYRLVILTNPCSVRSGREASAKKKAPQSIAGLSDSPVGEALGSPKLVSMRRVGAIPY